MVKEVSMSDKSEIEVLDKATLGRPKKPVDWKVFEDLCAIQCTQGEIASVLHLDVNTLHDRAQEQYGMLYADIYKKFSEIGKISLRRLQYKHAQKSFAMAIWLGKQWLGQRDHDQMIVAPPELTQQFNTLMVQIGKSQQSLHGSSESPALSIDSVPSQESSDSHLSSVSATDAPILSNNPLEPSNSYT